MPDSRHLSRWFLGLGGALALLGLAIWLLTPVRPMFPPYLVSAALAISYGIYCRRQAGPRQPRT